MVGTFEDEFADWATETIIVRNPIGDRMEGTVYDNPVPISGVLVERKRRLVRSADGRELVSETTVLVPSGKPEILVGARVETFGVRSTVLVVAPPTVPDVFDHTTVNLA